MKKAEKKAIKASLIETGKQLGSGLAGMVAGSAAGRHSLWLGAAAIFGGSWYEQGWLTAAGVGMVASNGFGKRNEESVDGLQDEMKNAKDRAVNSLKALSKKVFLDKLSPAMTEKLGLNGAEDSMDLMMEGIGNFDTSEVDSIIRQLEDGDASNVVGQDMQALEMSGYGMAGGDLGALGSPEMLDLQGSDALELNAVA